MKTSTFVEWLKDFDSSIVKTKIQKALLFTYNASCYETEDIFQDFFNIEVIFLAKRSASRLQTLHSGITAVLKVIIDAGKRIWLWIILNKNSCISKFLSLTRKLCSAYIMDLAVQNSEVQHNFIWVIVNVAYKCAKRECEAGNLKQKLF